MNQELIGHQKIVNFFEQAEENEQLSHAYCLVGPKNVGKSRIAERVSKKLLRSDELEKSPDFKRVKTRDSQEIKINQIREARSFVSAQGYGESKVLLIEEGEKMNQNSANAFLKTLEEPAEDTTIFVLLTDENSLPATINSRCQTIYVRPVDSENIEEYLKSQELDEDIVQGIKKSSCGLTEQARDWSKNYEKYEEFKDLISVLEQMKEEPFYEKTNLINDLYNSDRKELEQVISNWQQGLHLHLQTEIFELGLDFKEVQDVLRVLQKSKENLRKNINKKIILDKILQTIP
ncbi:MAG: AAA family ATPase [Candidatus Magasanikbacteria bacterium]